MSNILLLETSTAVCSVGMVQNGRLVALRETVDQQSHSELLTSYIAEVMQVAGLSFDRLDAVAVSKGPGSYTGLRIGVSTAKGICYARDIPLIAVDTLHAMAYGMKHLAASTAGNRQQFFCPMIDARRMEVYLAVYNDQLEQVEPVHAQVIDSQSMQHWFEQGDVWFAGDGAKKCMQMWPEQPAAHLLQQTFPSAQWMTAAAWHHFQSGMFENVAYFEPFYLKDFIAGIPRVKGLSSWN